MREDGTTVEVRLLERDECREAAMLQMRELPREFLSRLGEGFLSRYYQAFLESPYATALVVTDPGTGELDGVFIATFDTGAHYSYLVRRYGFVLTGQIALHVLRRPALALEFLRTRSARYARGILRSLIYKRKASGKGTDKVGFPTYIAVRSDRHGRGTGAALFEAYEQRARKVGLDRLELVTRCGGAGAGPFFDRLGYKHAGERVSRSGERYALYTKSL